MSLLPSVTDEEMGRIVDQERRARTMSLNAGLLSPSRVEKSLSVDDAWHNRTSTAVAVLQTRKGNSLLSLRAVLVLFGCVAILATGLVVFGICYAGGTQSISNVEVRRLVAALVWLFS